MTSTKTAIFFYLFLLAAQYNLTANAFVPIVPRSVTRHYVSDGFMVLKAKEHGDLDQISSTTKDPDGLEKNENALEQWFNRFLSAGGGEIGKRGEVYFFAQALPILGVVFGGVPVLSDALKTLAGPGLILFGVITMALTALEMGSSLTPWPRPNGEGLVTTGLYSQVRHPMYSGLLSSLTGFSVWTGSMDRVLLVILLWLVLQVKSDYEEQFLIKTYPEYIEYQEKVPTKFVPRALVDFGKPTSNLE